MRPGSTCHSHKICGDMTGPGTKFHRKGIFGQFKPAKIGLADGDLGRIQTTRFHCFGYSSLDRRILFGEICIRIGH